MESTIITALPNFGVAGFAIYILYLTYKDAATRLTKKDEAIAEQVEKHELTLKEHQTYMREIHSSTMMQLSHASKVIEDNVRSHERMISILNKK